MACGRGAPASKFAQARRGGNYMERWGARTTQEPVAWEEAAWSYSAEAWGLMGPGRLEPHFLLNAATFFFACNRENQGATTRPCEVHGSTQGQQGTPAH